MAFPDDFLDEPFDPNERKPIMYRCKLKPGERIVAATSDIVDGESKVVDTDSKANIVLRSFGQISGVKWGASAWVTISDDDITCCEVFWIRFRLEIDATPPLPMTKKIDQTWGVRVKQR